MNPDLSAREEDVIKLTALGHKNKKIAATLGIGVRTVETHRERAYRKMGVNDVVGATRWALDRKLVEVIDFGGKTPESIGFTEQQAKIVALIGEGKSREETASVLGISKRTVESHTYSISCRLHLLYGDIDKSCLFVHLMEYQKKLREAVLTKAEPVQESVQATAA